MRIAICSDIHDNIWKLESALPGMNRANVLIFCGDFCAPFTLTQIAHGFEGPVHAVFGNNDGDQHLLMKMAGEASTVTLHGQFADIEVGGLHIAVNHYPEIAKSVAAGGAYDVVCFGHDHTLHEEQVGETLLLNPGEIMGRFGRSTFMLLECSDRSVTVHDVE
ncbi:MAG: YfcE family phosphodiesterase [Chloroflexi bacterium]|nr:YfcE family phosphodiesterase [Chloroflexota bacterium]